MTIEDFIKKYDGDYVDIDAMYGNQCKDLFSAYNTEVVGCPFYIYGNANELWDNAPEEYYSKETEPERGDVVIWGTGIGKYGHVAIFNNLDMNGFVSFDQNYPIGSPCHMQYHNFNNIIGYLRPKGVTMTCEPAFIDKPMATAIATNFINYMYKEQNFAKIYNAPTKAKAVEWLVNNNMDFVAFLKEKVNITANCSENFKEAYSQEIMKNTELQRELDLCKIKECPEPKPCPDLDILTSWELIKLAVNKWLRVN